MKIRVLFFWCLFLLTGEVNAQSLLDQVRGNAFLLEGNLSILSCQGKRSLVAVGTAKVDKTKPSLVKRARIMAKVRAQNQLSQFIHDIKIELSEIVENHITIIGANGEPALRQQKQKYLEQIKETKEGSLKNIITLGAWIEKSIYYYVLAIPIE